MPTTTTSYHDYLKEHIKLKDSEQKQALEGILELADNEIDDKLISSGLVSVAELLKLKSDYFHIPSLTLDQIDAESIVHDLLPSSLIQNYRVVPFNKTGRIVKIAITDPTNLQILEALEFLARKNGWDIELYLISDEDMGMLLQKSLGVAADVKEALSEFTKDQKVRARTKAFQQGPADFTIEERAPVTKIVDGIITQALGQSASDVHIEPLEKQSRVRFRIDGVLQEAFSFPINAHNALVSRIKILANLKIDEQRLPQDGRFRFNFSNQDIDFRVSTFPTNYGEKVVLRALSRSQHIPTFQALGLNGQPERVIRQAMKKSHGMLLVTGPTGSGKSTTLFVALSELNKPGVNIVTLEDPVEYILPGANQAQINPEINFSFASGLRSILRQDPNIILVGEIRDKETAELAVHSALTGHLVFSTLHTNSAIGALPRLVDMGVEPFLIIASVNAIMAQRLVRVLCEECKKLATVTKEVQGLVEEELSHVPKAELEGLDVKNPKIYVAQGCKKCGHTGYKGRIAIFEAVEVTKELGDLTLAKASPHKLLETAQAQGTTTMKQDGFIKVLRGVTTIEEVLRGTTE